MLMNDMDVELVAMVIEKDEIYRGIVFNADENAINTGAAESPSTLLYGLAAVSEGGEKA